MRESKGTKGDWVQGVRNASPCGRLGTAREGTRAPWAGAGARAFLCEALALLLLCAVSASAFQQEPEIKIDPHSGIVFRIGLPLQQTPSTGFFPMHLQISNASGRERTWSVDVRNTGENPVLRWTTSVTVAAGQPREFDLLVPVSGLESVYAKNHSAMGVISGYGVEEGNFSIEGRYTSGSGNGFVAMSETLSVASWSKLEAALRPSGGGTLGVPQPNALASLRFNGVTRSSARGLRGSPVKLDEMPADARAFSGIGGLWLTDADWRSLAGDRRAAIRQWIMEGGHLFVGAEKPSEARLASLPPLAPSGSALGLGKVEGVKLEKGELPIEATESAILGLDGQPLPPWEQDFPESWPLPALLGSPTLNVPLIIAFVGGFALLIGPVNLVWLAPPTRRFLLFLTVPLLSLVASLILLGLIAFGDGIGGAGARNVLLLVSAGENRTTLVQEQVVRTRLLFTRRFELPITVACSYVPDRTQENRNSALSRVGTSLSGDWFRTRAVQSMFLRASIPSRAAVTLREPRGSGGAPELLSTMPGTLWHLHYIDPAGQYWFAPKISTGQPARLTAVTEEALTVWAGQVGAKFSAPLRTQLGETLHRKGFFYAEAEPGPETTIETLRGLAWSHQKIICVGSCTEGAP